MNHEHIVISCLQHLGLFVLIVLVGTPAALYYRRVLRRFEQTIMDSVELPSKES